MPWGVTYTYTFSSGNYSFRARGTPSMADLTYEVTQNV